MLEQLVDDTLGKEVHVTGYIDAGGTKQGDWGQCTAVPHYWQRLRGLPIVMGNAIDTYANAGSDYERIPNTPEAVPKPGAVIVWGFYKPLGMGPYGHTAVVLEADAKGFKVLEQNNPVGHVTRINTYGNYGGVIGWFYPKKLNVKEEADVPTLVDDNALIVLYATYFFRQPDAGAKVYLDKPLREVMDLLAGSPERQAILDAWHSIPRLQEQIGGLEQRLEVLAQTPKLPEVSVQTPTLLTWGDILDAVKQKIQPWKKS